MAQVVERSFAGGHSADGLEWAARANGRGTVSRPARCGRRSSAGIAAVGSAADPRHGNQAPNTRFLARMNGTGFTALARVAGAAECTSKCRCGPDDEPDVPTYPMTCPLVTTWPTVTEGRRTMW